MFKILLKEFRENPRGLFEDMVGGVALISFLGVGLFLPVLL